MPEQQFPIGRRIDLPGHFAGSVALESVRPLGEGFECRVRLSDGTPDEAILSRDEAATVFGRQAEAPTSVKPADAESIRLLVESARIRLAYTHDRHFAVSLSGIRTLPHQIEAVYLRMLPQPRLRYLLADDPGAGKTIMAGLLIKEMKLREAIDRVLILCPAPLTIQWQDKLFRWFGESFDIIFSAVDQHQLVNPWHRTTQVIASLDYAKQDNVRERVWSESWDLVIIDEAHKCSAYTKSSSGRGDEAEKTKRYQIAERLAANTDHLLLLTATPHHGDDDRFAHFIRLIDSDLFPEPHRVGNQATEIRRDILRLGPDCPWALRRLKEDLRDLRGRRLLPNRHAHTVAFKLTMQEYDLYKAVTGYINQFLPQAGGRKQASVALARTVFQRRLASSTMAICESIRRRLQRQQDLSKEVEDLPPAQRARRLAQLQGRLADVEQDEDDLDDAERDQLVDQFTASAGLEQLQAEVAALHELMAQARRVRDHGSDSKLAALKACLERAEFKELTGGRGKLLIFTEHRDTLNYLCECLARWGYTTCQIHGGMNPHERKRAQEQFRTEKQICVATEAAGEGINLQFCRLMINYDLPWNPTRLEQRLGRIHRIGQERDVHAFNFVASASKEGQPIVEGRILERLNELTDLERTRRERLGGLDRLILVKHGPVRHVATALALPAGAGAGFGGAPEDLDPNIRRRSELAAENLVVAYETVRGWECERVGHLKIGFDVRSLGPADTQTGYRDPVEGIRRIEAKGRTRGQPIHMTYREWNNAAQLGDNYWLYVVWDPLGRPDAQPLLIRNPFKYLEHAARPRKAGREYDIPAQAIEAAALATRDAR